MDRSTGSARFRMLRAAALVGLVVLAGCTSSFVYNRLDTLARWYIGSLVTLDDSQQADLRDWLGRSLAWHRSTELGRYEQFLRDIAARVSIGPDPSRAPDLLKQAEGFIGELVDRMAPEAAQLLVSLRPPQVDEFLGNLDKRNREELDEERDRTPADREKRRIKSMTRTLERWTGSSTPEQKALLERTVTDLSAAGLLGESDEWFASQVAWRNALRLALGKGSAGQGDVESLLRAPERFHTDAYRAAQAEQRRRFLALATELDASLTPKQRATLAAKLTDLAQDLKALQ
jgi:hypothetical protein